MEKSIIVLADMRKSEVCQSIETFKPWLSSIAVIKGWYKELDEINFDTLDQTDYIMVFGGDGLLLATARHLADHPIPVIGVNFGKLGFLAELTIDEVYSHIPRILKGEVQFSSRMMLQCQVIKEGQIRYQAIALNDAVIKGAAVARILYTSLHINDEQVANYGGDGIIIATPVGSTAYSLSAGGPIVSPSLSALIITPICPHVLTLRPLVVSDENTIKITFRPPCSSGILLTIDGQVNFPLEIGDEVHITKSKKKFCLVNTGHRSFFRILREKLTWGEVKLKNFEHE